MALKLSEINPLNKAEGHLYLCRPWAEFSKVKWQAVCRAGHAGPMRHSRAGTEGSHTSGSYRVESPRGPQVTTTKERTVGEMAKRRGARVQGLTLKQNNNKKARR